MASIKKARKQSILHVINVSASSPGANKKFHASHYMKGLHEVVRRDEQAKNFMRVTI
jgi:hypothetical protein